MSHLPESKDLVRESPTTDAVPAEIASASTPSSDPVADSEYPSWDRRTESQTPVPPVPSAVPPLDCPTLVGPYPIKGRIGSGGIGVVLWGYDAEFNRSLAVKLLQHQHKNNPDLAARFLDEAQLMGQLQHPNIPPVHRLGTTCDGRPYFSMKWIKGKTLAQMLKQRSHPGQDLPRFIGIFENICKALAYSHSRQVIHRDLKPANIMVGSLDELYVMDWGMAKRITDCRLPIADCQKDHSRAGKDDSSESENPKSKIQNPKSVGTRAGMGTVGFMPPEQILSGVGQVDPRSDVFGLGAILCVILTGKPPYHSPGSKELVDLAAGTELCGEGLKRLDECGADAELVDLASRCLAHRREERPAHAGIVAEAIAHYQAKVQEERRQFELKLAKEHVKRLERRKQRRLALLSSVLVCITIGVVCWHEKDRWHYEEEGARKDQVIAASGTKIEASKKETAFEETETRFYSAAREQQFAVMRSEQNQLQLLASQSKSVDLEQRCKQAWAHFNFIIDLESYQSWAAAALLTTEQMIPAGFADVAIGKILRDHGYWKEGEPAQQVAQRIKSSPIHVQLLTAFDQWATQTTDPHCRQWLQDVVRQADPNFKFRHSTEYQKLWGDEKKLGDLTKHKVPAPLLINEGIRRLHDGVDPLPGLRALVDADSGNYWAQLWLGMAYLQTRDFKKAREHFLEATRLRRESGVAFNNLACASFYQGQLEDARGNFERAAQLLSANHPLYKVVHEHLHKCHAYLNLEKKLQAYRKKQYVPKSPQEELQLADLCFDCKAMFLTAAELTAKALAAKPELSADALAHYRYQGARAAVLAAAQKGTDPVKPNAMKSKELRDQALAWLRSNLKYGVNALRGQAGSHALGQPFSLLQCLKEPDLAAVRDVKSELFASEKVAWEEFWSDVEDLLENRNPIDVNGLKKENGRANKKSCC